MASGGGASEAIAYKVSVLKVSIHCEGCKKKIHRILRKVAGVEEIEIDARQNKVAVKGPVDAQTLIHKLKKSGKHAELWHEERPSDQINHFSGNYNKKKESKESSESEERKEDAKKSMPFDNSTAASSAAAKHTDADKTEAVNKSLTVSKETKAEAENNTSKEIPEAVEKIEKAPASREVSGDSSNGEKMGKKSEKDSNVELAMNNPHPVFPPQPAYIMSYNMAQPNISQSHYVSQMPPASQGYMYPQNSYPPPPEYYYSSLDAHPSASVQQQDPYNTMFSDENPNACSLM